MSKLKYFSKERKNGLFNSNYSVSKQNFRSKRSGANSCFCSTSYFFESNHSGKESHSFSRSSSLQYFLMLDFGLRPKSISNKWKVQGINKKFFSLKELYFTLKKLNSWK